MVTTTSKRRQRGSIRRNGPGFQVRVYAGRDPLTKKAVYLYEQAATHEEAEKARTRLLHQVDEQRHPKSQVSASLLLDRWLGIAELDEASARRHAAAWACPPPASRWPWSAQRTLRPAPGGEWRGVGRCASSGGASCRGHDQRGDVGEGASTPPMPCAVPLLACPPGKRSSGRPEGPVRVRPPARQGLLAHMSAARQYGAACRANSPHWMGCCCAVGPASGRTAQHRTASEGATLGEGSRRGTRPLKGSPPAVMPGKRVANRVLLLAVAGPVITRFAGTRPAGAAPPPRRDATLRKRIRRCSSG